MSERAAHPRHAFAAGKFVAALTRRTAKMPAQAIGKPGAVIAAMARFNHAAIRQRGARRPLPEITCSRGPASLL